MTIKQHSPEWLEAKKSRVGASEIAGLVHYYCKDELKALKIDFEPYNTALQTWAKVKFGIELPFPKSISRWGLGMEEYIADRFNREQSQILAKRTDDFVINNDLMGCSPDGYVNIKNRLPEQPLCKIQDFDKQVVIDNTWGNGTLELKTTSFNQSSDFRDGFKWHYIFQMQHQMMCCLTNWGVGVVLIPKDPWEAEELEKGYILGKMEDKDYNKSGIDDLFFLEHFVYAKKPKLVELINMALNKFKSDLDNNILPMPYSGTKQTLLSKSDLNLFKAILINMALNKFKSDLDNNILPMPYSGTKQTLLANEKQVLAMLHPTRFGEVIADEVQDGLLSEMKILQAEKKKIECEEMEARNKVMHAIGDAIALIGTDYKAKFDSRMSLRFSKVK